MAAVLSCWACMGDATGRNRTKPARLRTDDDFTVSAKRLIERDRELFERLAR